MKTLKVTLIFLLLLTSCKADINQSTDFYSIGVWGPLPIKNNVVSEISVLTQNTEIIDLTLNFFDSNRELLFFEKPLLPGAELQFVLDKSQRKSIKKFSVREPCVIYIGTPITHPELWIACHDENPFQLTNTSGKVTGFSPGLSGEMIYFTAINETGGTDIFVTSRDGENERLVFTCNENACTELDFNEKINLLAFQETGNVNYIHITDTNGKIKFSYPTMAIDIRFSPNGELVRFFDTETQTLNLLNSTNGSIIRVGTSAEGLIGGWSLDSRKLLYGMVNYWGGIPGTSIYEYDAEKSESKLVIQNLQQDLEFYAPFFSENPGEYLVSVRQRNSGASKQYWIVKSDQVKERICEEAQFFCTQASWNYDYRQLLYQKYPANVSIGTPQIVIWDKNSKKEIMISPDGAMPKWLF